MHGLGTGRNESAGGPEARGHPSPDTRETEKRMHHLLPMRLKRVPQPHLILSSALAPSHPHPHAHTHKDKVIRLPVYCSGARKTTNIRVAGASSQPSPALAPRLTGLTEQVLTCPPACPPPSLPSLGHRPHLKPSLGIRNPARKEKWVKGEER